MPTIVDTLDPLCPNDYDTCLVGWKENCGNVSPDEADNPGMVLIEAMNAGLRRVIRCARKNGLSITQITTQWKDFAIFHYHATILVYGPQRIARKDPELWRAIRDEWGPQLDALCAGEVEFLDTNDDLIVPADEAALAHLHPEVMVDDGPAGWPGNGHVFAADPNDQFTQCAEEPDR